MLSLHVDVPGGRPRAAASITRSDTAVSDVQPAHLDGRSTIGDLLRHPAFARIRAPAPAVGRSRLRRADAVVAHGSLLPYHTHVDPDTVAAGLNRMIDDAADGRTVFYRFYNDAQTQQQPAKGKTGLFFFRGRPGAPFAVIAPGGGFSYVGLGPRRLPVCGRDQQPGLQRVRAASTGAGQGGRWRPRIWPRLSRTSSGMQQRSASAPPDTRYGGVRLARGWPPRSVRTAWRAMAVGALQSHQPS